MKKAVAWVTLVFMLLSCLVLPGCAGGDPVATVHGYRGDVTVRAALSDGGFVVELVSCDEREGLGTLGAEAMVERINTAGTLAVDVVSGATVTSSAVLAAAEQALVRAGASRELMYRAATDAWEYRYLTYDVVVVGAGAAGLTAAIEASRAGASVLVVEKQGVAGGSSARSEGVIAATGTDEQAYLYIDDSPTSFAASWLSGSGVSSNQLRILSLSERSADNLALLSELGVSFSRSLMSDNPSDRVPRRLHPIVDEDGEMGGGALVAPLVEAAEELGVDFLYDARVYEIQLGIAGEVTGVRARLADGGVVTVESTAVILATGGYDRSRDLMYEFLEPVELYSVSSPGNTGDGIELALAAGGALDPGFGLMTDLYDFYAGTSGSAGGMLVTPDGERFVREDADSFTKATTLLGRGEYARAYYIVDAAGATAAVTAAAESGTVTSADSLAALSSALDAPWLERVAALYNDLCAEGADPYYGKDPAHLIPLGEGPYYAIPYELRCFGTTGGIATDLGCAVVSAADNTRVVPGLYAAGECANGSYFAEGYPGRGYSLAQVIDTGIIAGTKSAEYVAAGGYTDLADHVVQTGDSDLLLERDD